MRLDAAWQRRLTLYPRLILIAIAAAFVIVITAGSGSDTATGRVGGDFPAFYSAGTIVAEGNIDGLYEPAVQAAAQIDLLGGEDGFIMYPYAPYVAGAYSAFSGLPYRTAYVIHTALMVAALVGALILIRPMISLLDRWFSLILGATATAYPIFVGTSGGQNTALTLLLLAAIWRALAEDHEEWAGAAVALLLFRPQYALPMLGLLFLGRHWRAVGTACIGATIVYAINAAMAGPGWISTWITGVRPLLKADAEVNAVNEIAPVGFLHAVLGADSTMAMIVGGAISVGIGLALSWLWGKQRLDLDSRFAVTAAGLMLLGFHTIYYDSSLALFAVLIMLDRQLIDVRTTMAIWVVGLIQLFKEPLGMSPLAPVVLALFALILNRLWLAQSMADERVLPIQDS
jgi:alpha-1,2-mannosyltransferase